MFGWESAATARASRSKRARACASVATVLRQDLDGDLALELVIARPVDLAHAAGADRGQDLVGGQSRPRRQRSPAGGRRSLLDLRLLEQGRRLEKARGRRVVRGQQRLDLASQLGVLRADLRQIGASRLARPLHGRRKHRLHLRPALRRHGDGLESSRCSHALATTHLRWTVALGDLQGRGSFVDRESAEKAQLHDLRLLGVERGELFSASSTAMTSTSRGFVKTSVSIIDTASPPPRFCAARRRA